MVKIGEHLIGENEPCLIIVEVGINHSGRTLVSELEKMFPGCIFMKSSDTSMMTTTIYY